jgi:hypothetical protein
VPHCGAIRQMGGTLKEGGSNLGSSVAPAGGAGRAPSLDPPGPQRPRTDAAALAGARPRANVNCLISCSHLLSSMISGSVCPRNFDDGEEVFASVVHCQCPSYCCTMGFEVLECTKSYGSMGLSMYELVVVDCGCSRKIGENYWFVDIAQSDAKRIFLRLRYRPRKGPLVK